MRVLLISTYELGHQPLHVASPAAALRRAGHEVRCLDLSVQPWDHSALEWTQAVGFSVPMHTAMRLALSAGRRARREHPELPLCFYGLYATVSRERQRNFIDLSTAWQPRATLSTCWSTWQEMWTRCLLLKLCSAQISMLCCRFSWRTSGE